MNGCTHLDVMVDREADGTQSMAGTIGTHVGSGRDEVPTQSVIVALLDNTERDYSLGTFSLTPRPVLRYHHEGSVPINLEGKYAGTIRVIENLRYLSDDNPGGSLGFIQLTADVLKAAGISNANANPGAERSQEKAAAKMIIF